MIESGDQRFLLSDVPFEVRHEEHGWVNVPAGKFRVIRQREYTHGTSRWVYD
jgi:hypothetical protein